MTDEQRQAIANKIAAILDSPAWTRRTVMAAVLAQHALENPIDGESTLYTALSTLRGGMADDEAMSKAFGVIQSWSDRMDARDPA